MCGQARQSFIVCCGFRRNRGLSVHTGAVNGAAVTAYQGLHKQSRRLREGSLTSHPPDTAHIFRQIFSTRELT